jgi:hypothetical protein
MALNPLKARPGIGALTFAAAAAPFVLATPAKAIAINFVDLEASDTLFGMVRVMEDGVVVTPPVPPIGEFIVIAYSIRAEDTRQPRQGTHKSCGAVLPQAVAFRTAKIGPRIVHSAEMSVHSAEIRNGLTRSEIPLLTR